MKTHEGHVQEQEDLTVLVNQLLSLSLMSFVSVNVMCVIESLDSPPPQEPACAEYSPETAGRVRERLAKD